MKQLFKIQLLVLCFIFSAVNVTFAQQQKPYFILAVKNYESLFKAAEKYADLVGYKMEFQLASGQYVKPAGLDVTKPAGVCLLPNKTPVPFFFAFLPVTDFEKTDFFKSLPPEAFQKKQNGVYLVPDMGAGQSISLEMINGYLCIFPEKMKSQIPSGDPVTLLEGIEKEYNIAVKIDVANIPDVFKMGLPAMLDTIPLPNQTPETKAQIKEAKKGITTFLKEINVFTIGIKSDPATGDLGIKMFTDAKPSTSFAKQYADGASAKTFFSKAAELSDTVFYFSSSPFPLDPTLKNALYPQVTNHTQGIVSELKQYGLTEKQHELAKTLVESVGEAINNAVKQPTVDGVFSFANKGNIFIGVATPDAEKIAATIIDMKPEIAAETVNIDYQKWEGFSFTSIELPQELMQSHKNSMPILNNKFIVLAMSKDIICLANGSTLKDAEDFLKAKMGASPKQTAVNQMVAYVSYMQVYKLLTTYPEGELPPGALEGFADCKSDERAVASLKTKYSTTSVTAEVDVSGAVISATLKPAIRAAKEAAERMRNMRQMQPDFQMQPPMQMQQLTPEQQKQIEEQMQRYMEQQMQRR
ncbi:MAG: hypothetical protein ACRC2T_16590 [Thermoguttaceae bacterium]